MDAASDSEIIAVPFNTTQSCISSKFIYRVA